MPRGEHFRKVTEGEIRSVFERDDLPRKLLSPAEVADILNKNVLQGEEISSEAVRQRMHKIDGLEKEELGTAVLWKKEGVKVFADGGLITIRRDASGNLNGNIGRVHFEDIPAYHFAWNMALLSFFAILTISLDVAGLVLREFHVAGWVLQDSQLLALGSLSFLVFAALVIGEILLLTGRRALLDRVGAKTWSMIKRVRSAL